MNPAAIARAAHSIYESAAAQILNLHPDPKGCGLYLLGDYCLIGRIRL